MKKHFKRWIAFLLAVVLVTTTCLFSSDSFLRASEDGEAAKESVEETMETQELIVPQPEEPAQEPAPAEEEPAPVQEPAEETQPVQPEEPAGDMPTGDEIEVTPETPAAEETIVPTPEPAVEETVVPTPEPAAEEPAATEEPAPTSTPAATPEMPAATQTPTASAVPTASASPTPTATPDGEEETKSFGYEIRYYYDGVEDEESRVVKEDGVPDEPILDADTVKEKLIRDGKEYTLDKIVNKNGKITENAEDNVVEVYYVSASEEKPETTKAYSLKFKTVPSKGGRVEVISPKAEETDTGNTYKEDTEVTFEVSAKEGYELLSVENQDEEELKADSEEEGISTYAVTMTEDMVVTVTFEEVKQEVKMPAQTFETSAGGISITISAPEGVLPEGTTVKAVPVSRSEVEDAVNEKLAEEGMKAVDIVAVDITLYDKDGNEIQPKGELSVTFGNISASENAETAAVFHVDTDSNAAEKVAEVSTEASAAGFQTDHFSVWTYVTGESVDTLAADEVADGSQVVYVGDTVTLDCPENKHDKNMQWTPSDSAVATVDGSGNVYFVSEGIVTVSHRTRKSNRDDWRVCYTAAFTVRAVQAESITLNKERMELMVGKSESLVAAVVPEKATVTWSSSNTNVATVDRNGKVTARGIGEAIITAASGEVSVSAEVTVTRNIEGDREQTAYFYVWKPGVAEDTNYTEAWHYMGTGTVKAPAAVASGTMYYDTTMVKSYPNSFKDIQVDGQNYTYDPTGTGDYTYKIQWSEIVDSNGANNGNDVITNVASYHVNGYAVLKTPNMVTVDFQVRNPGSDGFASVEISKTDKWPKIFKEGSDITAPGMDAIKTVNGVTYRFDGWYNDSTCSSKAGESDFTNVRDNLIFYGRYIADFELVYDANGADSGSVPASIKRPAGTEVTISGNSGSLDRTGYEFGGWNTEADGSGTAYSAGSKIELDANVTLYAQWRPGKAGYTVEYYQQNLDDDEYILHETVDTNHGTTGEGATAIIKEYAGFEHVITDDSVESGTIMADGSLVLKVYYDRVTYSVEYDLDGGNSTTEQLSYTGLKYGVATPVIVEPTKMGCVFAGWAPEVTETVEGNAVYAAQWQPVTLTAVGYDRPYDGEEHGPESVTFSGANALSVIEYQVDRIWTTEQPKIQDVGTATYNVRALVRDIVVAKTTVTLTVTPKEVTVTADNSEKMFGTEDPAFTAKVEGTLNNDRITYSVSRPGAGTDEAPGTYGGAIVATGAEAQGNYKVSYVAGDFEIKTNTTDLTLTAADGGGEYNALPYRLTNVRASLADAVIEYRVGDGVWTTDAPSATDVSESLNGISVRARLDGYQTAVVEGLSIAVTRKPVTVTAQATGKKYNTPDPEFAAKVDGVFEGDGDKIVYTVSRPGAGTDEAPGTYERAVVAEGAREQGNYEVSYVPADFTISINDVALTLTAADGGGEYNAQPYRLTNVGASLADAVIEYRVGDGVWTTDAPSATDVSESLDGISVRARLDGYQTVTVENLSIVVRPKPVTVTADKKEKMFGKDDPEFTVSVTGTLGDDRVSYGVSRPGAGTDEAPGTYKGAIVATGAEAQGNYKVTYVNGNFEIKTNTTDLTLTASSGGGIYRAEAYGLNGVEASLADAVIEYQVGDGVWTTTAPSVTDVSESLNGISVRASLAGYQTATVENLSIVVTPKPVTLSSVTASKEYDGSPLMRPEVDYSGFISGEATAEAEGTATYAGATVVNTIIVKPGTEYKESNYDITKNEGTLTITDTNVDVNMVVRKTHGAGEYALGDTITFAIEVTNIYNEAKTISIREQAGVTITGNAVFENVASGASVTTTATYVVQQSDILNGSFTNHVTASFEGEREFENEDTVDDFAKPNGHLTLTKETTSTPANGAAYALGETITYEIRALNDGNLILTDVVVTDDLTGDSWTISEISPGQRSTAMTTSYVVTENDILAGKVRNEAVARGTSPDPDEPEVPVTSGIKEDPTATAAPSLFVEKTASASADGGSYGLGEEVTYTIHVVNNGNVTVSGIEVTDDLTGDSWTIGSLAPNGDDTFTATYTVTENDLLKGSIDNTAAATGKDPNGNDVTGSATKSIATDTKEGHLTLTKETTSAPANGSEYVLGETITYRITVVNDGNLTLTDIAVTDDLTGDRWDIASLEPGAEQTFETEHMVDETDVLAGRVVNEATATGISPDPDQPDPGVDPGETEDLVEEKEGHLTLTKETTSTPANGSEYVLGETITYRITVVNDGNLTLTDIAVTDDLTGDRWDIASLEPGAEQTFETEHMVDETDVLAGRVVNEATATGISPDPDQPDPGVDPGETEDLVEEKEGHLTLTKETTSTPANGAAYALGETITYEIRALNDGNLTLTDVVVTDDLTGDSWTISEISPGQRSTAMMTSYTVTEADILAGSVVNVVTASGTSPDPDEPDVPVTPGMEEDPTSVPEPSLFAEKTASASVDGGTYGLGEEVTYTIRIVNNGNVTISNIEVKDDLTGDSWTTANLAPGESGSFEAVYTVTEDDIRAGRILNVASASGTAPDGNPVDAAEEEEIFTDALDGSVNVVKTVTNPRTQYNVGDVINYQITVTNTGNVTLHNVRVEDVLNGTEGSVTFTDLAGGILENSTVVLPELAVGETANLRCEYTVARGDANASIGNRVEVTSDEGDDPSDDETDVTPVENIYNLTIHYVYADGTTAAPDVTAQYLEGESFSYTSPTIEGYTPNFLFLRTDVQGMPAKDVELTVVYTANPAVVTPPADDTPPAPPADDTPADDTPPAPPTVPVVPPADDTPVVPPAPPAPPAVPAVPAGPVAPVVPAPDDGLVAVEEEPVPTGGAVVADDDGNLTILPVEDEEVPLTNRQLDDHSCCILSFLLMLAAMIVYTCYTSSMKKRQKKIAKLRDQYEAEILRRELGLPSENNR